METLYLGYQVGHGLEGLLDVESPEATVSVEDRGPVLVASTRLHVDF